MESVPADTKYCVDPSYETVPTPPPHIIPELTAIEESTEERHWRSVVIGGVWRRIDMKVIAPYRKVSLWLNMLMSNCPSIHFIGLQCTLLMLL